MSKKAKKQAPTYVYMLTIDGGNEPVDWELANASIEGMLSILEKYMLGAYGERIIPESISVDEENCEISFTNAYGEHSVQQYVKIPVHE